MYIHKVLFEWDENKAAVNLAKHGLSFDEAATCFVDSNVLVNENPTHSIHERRLIAIAKSAVGRVLVVVFTIRRRVHGKKVFRIISARQANKKERRVYDRR